jgi:hypothetical protein
MRRAAYVLPLLVLVASACSPDHYPQTALRPLSDFAKIGDDIQTTTFEWALGVFILVEGALLYAIFRFRGKPDDPEPRQVHGNTTIEIIWTVIPALILAAIAVPTVRGIFETNAVPTGDVLKVEVVGHQWWWEFRYPDLNLTTANESTSRSGRRSPPDGDGGRRPQLLAARSRASGTSSRTARPPLVQAEQAGDIRGSVRNSAASSTGAWRSDCGRDPDEFQAGWRTCRRYGQTAPPRPAAPPAGRRTAAPAGRPRPSRRGAARRREDSSTAGPRRIRLTPPARSCSRPGLRRVSLAQRVNARRA